MPEPGRVLSRTEVEHVDLLPGDDDYARGYNDAVRDFVWPLTTLCNERSRLYDDSARMFASAVRTMGTIRVSRSLLRQDLILERSDDPTSDQVVFRALSAGEETP